MTFWRNALREDLAGIGLTRIEGLPADIGSLVELDPNARALMTNCARHRANHRERDDGGDVTTDEFSKGRGFAA